MQVQTQQAPTEPNNGQIVKSAKVVAPSERFAKAIEREFSGTAGEIAVSGFQRKLCQNYFIKIDMILKEAEKKRLAKSEKYRDPLPLTWENINLQQLAIDVITFSSVGLDPLQPNHINPVAFKNKATNKYDLTFIMGYKGTELKSRKYGFDVPDDVVVELVYATDIFRQIKKDTNNKIENYVFEITNNFDRGELVGGFYYHRFFNHPEKNKLKVYSRKDIEKRKPKYASVEFWGGERDKWENGQHVGKETVEGWYDEMAYKTIYRAAYNSITIDSEKIDGNYLAVIQKDTETKDRLIANEIANNANGETIGFDEVEAGSEGKPEQRDTNTNDQTSETNNIVDSQDVQQPAAEPVQQLNQQVNKPGTPGKIPF